MKNITDKLQSRGAQSLTDTELVALTLAEHQADDSAIAMAEEVLKASHDSLQHLVDVDIQRLRMMAGMGRMRALRLQAAAEIGRRVAIAEAAAHASSHQTAA